MKLKYKYIVILILIFSLSSINLYSQNITAIESNVNHIINLEKKGIDPTFYIHDLCISIKHKDSPLILSYDTITDTDNKLFITKPKERRIYLFKKSSNNNWVITTPVPIYTSLTNNNFIIDFNDYSLKRGGCASIFQLNNRCLLVTSNYREYFEGRHYSYPIFVLLIPTTCANCYDFNVVKFLPTRIDKRYALTISEINTNEYIVSMNDKTNIILNFKVDDSKYNISFKDDNGEYMETNINK
jgi:hypothetical protein